MVVWKGWTGKILRVNLTTGEVKVQEYDAELALNFVGGRGFAAKILWDELRPGTDPLSPENKLVVAAGPLTALPIPSSGKLVIASKSPLTGGYGDGNIGTEAAVQLRRAGYDALVIEGALKTPGYLYIEDSKVEIQEALDTWGMDTFTSERRIRARFGEDAGVLLIGPAGENLVPFATVVCQEGRSGGRPGMGAVMGSKRLKAIVIRGTGEPTVAKERELEELASKAYDEIKSKPGYEKWTKYGTMMTVRWSQEASVLPTYNFSEGVFEEAESLYEEYVEEFKVRQRGCPHCNMPCGNVIAAEGGVEVEVDYENIAMLGSNLGIGNLRRVALLNRRADELGVDTISLGAVIGFAMEATERKLIKEGIEWGDFNGVLELIDDIVYGRTELGRLLAKGVRRATIVVSSDSWKFAMHVKGLEVSGYDCHAAPAMALAYGTSPVGAHHKDAWVIAWEVSSGDRLGYGKEKVEKVVELQRIRGGMFETLVACRLPWVELGLDLDYYPRLLEAATGIGVGFDDLMMVADRVYNIIRAFWVREYHVERRGWSYRMDYPPQKWFESPLTKGPLFGAKLDPEKYRAMLEYYYKLRGWDSNGIPRKSTLSKFGLDYVAKGLEEVGVRLSE